MTNHFHNKARSRDKDLYADFSVIYRPRAIVETQNWYRIKQPIGQQIRQCFRVLFRAIFSGFHAKFSDSLTVERIPLMERLTHACFPFPFG